MARYLNVKLTEAEAKALLEAVGQMTDGNARDYSEWARQTNGSPAAWRALLRGERILSRATKGLDRPKAGE